MKMIIRSTNILALIVLAACGSNPEPPTDAAHPDVDGGISRTDARVAAQDGGFETSSSALQRACAWMTACGYMSSFENCARNAALASPLAFEPTEPSVAELSHMLRVGGDATSCEDFRSRVGVSVGTAGCTPNARACDGDRIVYCGSDGITTTLDCARFGRTCVLNEEGVQDAHCASGPATSMPNRCEGNVAINDFESVELRTDCGEHECDVGTLLGSEVARCRPRTSDCRTAIVCQGSDAQACVTDDSGRVYQVAIPCGDHGGTCDSSSPSGCRYPEDSTREPGCEGTVAYYRVSSEYVARFDCGSLGLTCEQSGGELGCRE